MDRERKHDQSIADRRGLRDQRLSAIHRTAQKTGMSEYDRRGDKARLRDLAAVARADIYLGILFRASRKRTSGLLWIAL